MARTNWKKAYQEQAKELNKTRHKLDSAETILSALDIGGSMDLECIYDMEENHSGTIEQAMAIKDDIGSISFGNFVMAVKDVSIEEVADTIEDYANQLEKSDSEDDNRKADELRAHFESFTDMIIDDNYMAWGGIADWGSYDGEDNETNHDLQQRFAEFVTGESTKEEFLTELKKTLKLDVED